jgi:hypothetical protein
MAKSHADLGIGKADYLAVVEMLRDALDAQRIPFGARTTHLLARHSADAPRIIDALR